MGPITTRQPPRYSAGCRHLPHRTKCRCQALRTLLVASQHWIESTETFIDVSLNFALTLVQTSTAHLLKHDGLTGWLNDATTGA